MPKKLKNEAKKQQKREKKYAKQRKDRGYADVDVWNLDCWFMNILPPMLCELRDHRCGHPAELDEETTVIIPKADAGELSEIEVSGDGESKWHAILSAMIDLLTDMNEETCRLKNPMEKQWRKAHKEFTKKYGVGGKKLRTAEDKKREKEQGLIRAYMPSDVPEYKDIVRAYLDEEIKISGYRDACKDAFFGLFSKYFWNLWD